MADDTMIASLARWFGGAAPGTRILSRITSPTKTCPICEATYLASTTHRCRQERRRVAPMVLLRGGLSAFQRAQRRGESWPAT